jgi:hypothetical protein
MPLLPSPAQHCRPSPARTRGRSAPGRLATLSCALVLGCAEPELGKGGSDDAATADAAAGSPLDRDAGKTRQPVPDGGNDPDAAGALATDDAAVPTLQVLPEWAKPLLGRFAVRSFTLKQDEANTVTRSEDTTVAEFTFSPERGLMVTSKLCRSRSKNALADLSLLDPTEVPERVESVLLDEKKLRWSTRAAVPLTIGFTEEPPAPCSGVPGMTVDKFPYQTWINEATCRCGAPNDQPTPGDCRVLDPDHDGKPGFSFSFVPYSVPLLPSMIFAVSRSTTHFTNGIVSADGLQHSANMAGGEEAIQLDCEPVGCATLGTLGRYCPDSYNVAQLVRRELTPGSSSAERCQDLLDNVDALFPGAPPGYEMRCYSQ